MSTSTIILLDALRTFKDFVQDNDVQVQTIQVFLKIASSSGSPSMEELIKTTGIGMSAVSRNVKKLSVGTHASPGYRLLTVELDPYDNRRRVLSLSHKGKELVQKLENSMVPHLNYMVRRLAKND